MPNPDFQVTLQDLQGSQNDKAGAVITISGRLDFTTASQALTAVNEQMAAHPKASVIDLFGVTHSNSAGLALMIEWLAEAQRSNRELRFENIPDSLRQISTVCQVDSLI